MSDFSEEKRRDALKQRRRDSPPETLRERQPTKRSIFRDEAVRRYAESQEKSVLPPLSPKTFLYLWSLVGLLAASSVVIWLAIKPVTDLNNNERLENYTKNLRQN